MASNDAAVRSETADDWNLHWDNFAKAAALNPAQHYRFGLMLSLLEENGLRAGSKLLDIGSGQGDFAVAFAKRFPKAELTGFELSESGVAISKEKVPAAEFYVANLFEMPAELEKYKGWAEYAVCSEVLEHLDEPSAFLQAAKDYLAPGGTLIITVPGGPMSQYDKYIGHRGHFTKERLAQTVEKGGLKPVDVLAAGFPFFNLYRSTVILRGKQLIKDAGQATMPSSATTAMGVFKKLFNLNVRNFPAGWQMVCVAKKP
jgi:2-polyprenyl-3-methyl-5-hydroxy-6-metoxy-1,4-benzoquinol methylase